jgi:ABC-type transport system substrate-binding protein
VDVDDIIRNVLERQGPARGLMLTDRHFGFDPAIKPIKQDMAKSKQLLAEAGFPGGLEITLNSPQGRYVRDKEVAEAIAGQLTKAGIRTTVRTHEWVHYFGNLAYKPQDAARVAHRLGVGGPTMPRPCTCRFFRSGRFLSNYYNADFEGMIETGAIDHGREEALRALPAHQPPVGGRRRGHAALSADRSVWSDQAHGVEGAGRRGHQGLRDGLK